MSNDAAVKDVRIILKKEECALGMEHSAKDAAVKDAQMKRRKEGCVLGMGQRSFAAEKDAQTMLR